MDNRPIGVFDSGLGGLSCVAELKQQLKEENILYFGDVARMPYGDKTPDTIRYFAFQIADFLLSKGAKALVIACNTVSALWSDALREHYPGVPIVDIISPAVNYVKQNVSPEKTVGIVATKATVNSGIYEKLLRQIGFQGNLCSAACPLFVPLIENGFWGGVMVETATRHYMDEFVRKNHVETLVLGCSHYPFIEQTIRTLFGDLEIINPSQIIARSVAELLQERDMLADSQQESKLTVYASDLSDTFVSTLSRISSGKHCEVKRKVFEDIYSFQPSIVMNSL